jgi:uncharacterized protein (TIGR02145 family)
MTLLEQKQHKMVAKRILTVLLGAGLWLAGCSAPPEEQKEPAAKKIVAPAEKGTLSVEGRTYPTLKWDTLTWLGANLQEMSEKSWCYNQNEERCAEEGRLYRWASAQEACAKLGEGWRLPSVSEWETLAKRFGGFQDYLTVEPEGDPIAANRALLQAGESGFAAILTGWRGSNGGYADRGEASFFWTSTPGDRDEVYTFQIQKAGKKLTRRQANPKMGFSCRCVKIAR